MQKTRSNERSYNSRNQTTNIVNFQNEGVNLHLEAAGRFVENQDRDTKCKIEPAGSKSLLLHSDNESVEMGETKFSAGNISPNYNEKIYIGEVRKYVHDLKSHQTDMKEAA